MGLFGTKPQKRGRVLRASGMRIQTGNHDTIRALAASRQDWQRDAWDYRDMIGELRFGLQFITRAVSRVRFMPAEIVPGDDEPIPLDAEDGITIPAALRTAAQEELERLPLDSGYGFTGILAENLRVTGECWVHGYLDESEERWEILSTDEVVAGSDGRLSIRRFGEATQRVVGEDEEMLRLWIPHPRYKMLADSPMRALLGPCEDLVLAGREMRAASRSRFAANGLLLVPEGLTMLSALNKDRTLIQDNSFMADLAAMLLAPISNEGDPGGVVPGVLSGDPDDLDKVRHLRMEREDSPTLLGKQDASLARIGRGMDIPPEIITGVADANHWTAWQIDSSTYRHFIDPLVRDVDDSLTAAFLRPALRARGFSAADVKRVTVWHDAGVITENPNRGQDARDAFDRGAIGPRALNKELGFNPADMPDDEEFVRMVAFRTGVDGMTAALWLQQAAGANIAPIVVNQPSERADQQQLPAGDAPAQPGTEQEATPGNPPQMSDGGRALLNSLIAAQAPRDLGYPEFDIDEDAGHRLMELDRATRDRLLIAADAALTRALEKAGARLRSKAQRNAATRVSLADVDVMAIGRTLGRDAVLALGIDERELLDGALDALEGRFATWVTSTIESVIDVVLGLLSLTRDSERGAALADRMRESMTGRIGGAWSMFRDALMRLAERYLFEPLPDPDTEGETVPDVIVPPGLVRGALAYIGGAAKDADGIDADGEPARAGRPAGGIGLGEDVTEILDENGVYELGFQWVYGLTMGRHFEPHLALDGERFASWDDPRLVPDARYAWVGPAFRPGDHKGCMCDYVPGYAIADRRAMIQAELDEPEPAGARDDRVLAEQDDAAGRTGTSAQLSRDARERLREEQRRWVGGL